ncbi:MAG: alpha/beta hydrolase [Pyrinomonadaceae bacterium]
MPRNSIFLLVLIFAVFAGGAIFARAQTPENWVDYVGSEYETIPNITYRTANDSEVKLDVYLPRNRQEAKPTLIFIHGGGWVEGRKETDVLLTLPYLSMGWSVVNVEYRLARNSLAPAAVEDTRCALRWVYNHADEFKFDTSKIVLTGFSAGGHLALITGMLPGNSDLDHGCPTENSVRWTTGKEAPLKVAAIVNWFGITDINDLLAGPNAKHYAIEWFGSLPNREELARSISPLANVRADLPPIITIHGDADDLVPYSQAANLKNALDRAGVDNQLITIKGGRHGGFSRTDTVNAYVSIRAFLRKHNLTAVN